MKNGMRILICTVVLFILLMPLCHSEEILTNVNITANCSLEDMKVFVKGEIKGYENRNISVVMYEVTDEINDTADINDSNAAMSIREIVQGKTDKDGKFDISVPVSENLPSGKYKVTVGGNWTAKVYDGVEWKEIQNDSLFGTFFDYASVSEQLEFIEDVALADKDEILGVLENISPIIFDYDDKFGNYEDAVEMFVNIRDELYPDGFNEEESTGKALAEINRVYKTAYSLLILNNSNDASEKTEAAKTILDTNDIMPEEVDGDNIARNIADDKIKYKTYADFEKNAKIYIGLDVLNNATVSGITEVLEEYAEDFGIELSEYEKTNRTAVNKYLHNKNFTDIEAVEEALEKGISEYKKGTGSTNSKVSGGSGGGGGRVTASPSVAQKEEEVEQTTETNGQVVQFTDLDGYGWAVQYINKLSEKGVVSGKTDKEFAPGDMVSRAEFAKMIAVAFELENGGEAVFNDVSGDEWYAEYISALNNWGVMLGDENGNANPDANITRQDMAVMLYRTSAYCEIALDKINSRAVFNDRDEISDYAETAVEELQQAGIINGNGQGGFAPKAFATRAEAAKMICCLADLAEK